ncbi:MAG: hypothetical protein JWQ45_1905 [Blastococcus sp.]|jgi:hypothetical protein|nr:hypothetical protein [Blastococcus sp.]
MTAAPDVGPPTVVSLDWDYAYESVLRDVSPGVSDVRLLKPAELGLSPALAARLAGWHERQDVLSGRWVREEPDTDESRREESALAHELSTLAYDVQHELGRDVEVLLHGRPLHERPRR